MGSQGVLGLTLLATALVAAACSKGDESASIDTVAPSTSTTVTDPATPPPCKDNRHLVVFDINGTLTLSEQATVDWLQDSTAEPAPRAGAADLVQGYREHGYEIMYVTSLPASIEVAGQPIGTALTGWLQRHGFPMDKDKATVNTSTTDNGSELSSELVALAGQSVSVDVAYTNNEDDVAAFETAGIATIYALGAAVGTTGTTAVARDDLAALVPGLKSEPPVCS